MAISRWRKWLKSTKAVRSSARPVKIASNSRMCLERLEDRMVPASLDISAGSLTYAASAGIDNHLTIGLTEANYNFTDIGETITLSAGAMAAGWTGSGTNTVAGPAASVTTNFAVNLLTGLDALNVNGPIRVAGAISLLSGQDLTLDASLTTTASGDITLKADNPAIHQAINPGTGTVLLAPITPTLKIHVGTASIIGNSFGLTNADLGWITSGVTQIGVLEDTGNIVVTDFIDDTPTAPASSRSQTLALFNGGAISDNDGVGRIKVQNLALQASAPSGATGFVPTVSLTNTKNDVANLVARLQGYSYFVNGFAVNIADSIVGLSGITTGVSGGITLTAPAINLAANIDANLQDFNGPVTLSADVTLTTIGANFEQTIESPGTPHSLTIIGTGIFKGPVGGNGNPLASLTIGAGKATDLQGQAVTTTGAQIYSGRLMTYVSTITLSSSDNQPISFGEDLELVNELVLVTTARTTLSASNTLSITITNTSSSALSNSSGGAIELGGARLFLSATNPVLGQTYTIVSSPLGQITGTFANLPEGAYIYSGGAAFRIHYTATAVTLLDTLVPPTITSADHTTFALQGGVFYIQTTGLPNATIKVTGTLPDGVTFTDGGTGTGTLFLAHTSSTPGVFPLTITASNGASPDATQQFMLTISGIPNYAITPNQRFVAQVYVDLFHKVVDTGGLAYWSGLLDQGALRDNVVLALERDSSNQFQTREVEQIYQRFLHRAADPGGLQFGINLLNGGIPVQQFGAILIGSAEFYATQGGGTDQGFLEAMYQNVLHRPIDPDALQADLSYLAQGGDRTQLALFVTTSPEATSVLVELTYESFLARQADPGGLAYFTQALQNGATYEQLVAALMGSAEYQQTRVGAA